MRTLYYPSWKKLFSESKGADVWYPGEIRIYDEVEKANSTIVVLKSVDLAAARGQHLHQGLAGVEEPMRRGALLAGARAVPGHPGSGATGRGRDVRRQARRWYPRAVRRAGVLSGGKPDAGTRGPPPSETVYPGGRPDLGGQGIPLVPAQEARGLDAETSPDAFATGRVQEDPLKIGGLFYTRIFLTALQNQPFDQSTLSFPTLVDVYLDARPTDRLRAFVLGRLTYDPFFAVTVGGTALPGVPASTVPSNPAVVLDQAWLAFDIGHAVFLTVGRQHVKWGVARFFSPTDFLASQPRDPLALFDSRLGVTMIRAQVPWERAGWNFTAIALFEPTQLVGGGYSGSAAVENPGDHGYQPHRHDRYRAPRRGRRSPRGVRIQERRVRPRRAGAAEPRVARRRRRHDVARRLRHLRRGGVEGVLRCPEQPDVRPHHPGRPLRPDHPREPSGRAPPGDLPPRHQPGDGGHRPPLEAGHPGRGRPHATPSTSRATRASRSAPSTSTTRPATRGASTWACCSCGGFQPFYVGKHYLALSATLRRHRPPRRPGSSPASAT